MVVYISTKFHENILDSIKGIQRTQIFIGKISKGHYSIKILVELQFLFSGHRLIMVYICTMFHENILNGIRVMERTQKVNKWTDRWMDGQMDGGNDII